MHLVSLLLLASAFWGQTPSCGSPTITSADLPTDVGYEVVGFSDPANCRILIDPRHLRSAGMTCMVVLHEYGHLLGFVHSSDPESLMYPVIRRPVWPCKW